MTAERNIRVKLTGLLEEKLRRLGVGENDLKDDFDLVKTGLVNSLEFVDIVSAMEKDFQVEIDYEEALERNELTSVGGLVRAFSKCLNG